MQGVSDAFRICRRVGLVQDGFVGIDVAFAKKKKLPVVLCTVDAGRLVPVPLRRLKHVPPSGLGNAKACDPDATRQFARDCRRYLQDVCTELGIRIRRIAIDAPRLPRADDQQRRLCEVALDRAGISCFTTPHVTGFQAIREKVAAHLRAGGAESRLPHANQLWMQPGFMLFEELEEIAECIEVYPQAIVRVIGSGELHKSRRGSALSQLKVASRFTGWPINEAEQNSLKDIGWAPTHDLVDAYLSAWVASLDECDRRALGHPPHDVIWVPHISA